MARINFDDDVESQEEFWALLNIIGDRDACLGKLLRFFRLCQSRYGRGESVSQQTIEDHGLNSMLQSGWAIPFKEGFQAKGAEKHFAWYEQRCIASKRAASSRSLGNFRPTGHRDDDSGHPLSLSLALSKKKEKRESTTEKTHPLVELWNKEAGKGLRKIKGCEGKRKTRLNAAWGNKPLLDYWSEVIKKINQSSFCTGSNDRNWKADFDFMLQPGKHIEIMEGKYDSRSSESKKGMTLEELKAQSEQ